MGIGRFDQAKHQFNLVVSINYAASPADLLQLNRAFQRASELLYDATDGKHQFGEITVCRNSSGGSNADIWIIISPNQVNPIVDSDGYDPPPFSTPTPGVHMTLDKMVMDWPILIVHEFAHFVYGLYDEYRFPDGSESAHCVGKGGNSCIMEARQIDGDRNFNPATGLWTPGVISEFCIDDPQPAINSDGTLRPRPHYHSLNNEQQFAYDDPSDPDKLSHSCWKVMANRYPDLVKPSGLPGLAGLPTEQAPAGAAAIKWVEVDALQRCVLAIDRSSNMMGNKLTEAKVGAHWWADSIPSNEQLAIVSFSDTASVDYPMHPITSQGDRGAVKNVISSLNASGATSIREGLLKARNEILNPTDTTLPAAVTKIIVLLTDGRHNHGPGPDTALLQDLAQNQIKVYPIGIGPDVDTGFLQGIAAQTGGIYYVC